MTGLVDCPHARVCAGCPAIGLPVSEQLARKHERVRRALERHGALARTVVLPVRAADPIERYRRRAKLVVGPGAELGLYGWEGEHRVIDVPGCRVLAPALGEAAAAVRELLVGAGAPLGAVGLLAVDLREVVDPAGGARVLVTLVLDEARRVPRGSIDLVARALVERAPVIGSVATSRRAADAPQVLGRMLELVLGPPTLKDSLDGSLWMPAVHGGFVQQHRGQSAALRVALADALAERLGGLEGRTIVDAYCGSGANGLALAARGARVTGIEAHAPAARAARRAAEEQGLDFEAIEGAAETVLAATRSRPAAIVLNPPRRGLAPSVRRACAALGPQVVAYVSCDPDTLARDLDHLARLGWRAPVLQPFDLMPLTEEVEVLALLEPAPAVPRRVLHEDDELLVLEGRPHDSADGSAVLDPPSGVRVMSRGASPAPRALRVEAVALCRGVMRARGRVGRSRYRRLRVVGGHSLIALHLDRDGLCAVQRGLAAIGHPVLGDERHGHAASNRHFAERHGLDRAFLHCVRVELAPPGDPVVIESALSGDLELVLERLERNRQRPMRAIRSA